MDQELKNRIEALAERFEGEASWNIKPGKLRQGCMTLLFKSTDGTFREGTEEEYDRAFAALEWR